MNLNEFKNFRGRGKGETRNIATIKLPGMKPARHAVSLPSKGLLCVKAALEAGTVDKNTQFTFFENNLAFVRSIQREADKLGLNYRLVAEDITWCDLCLAKGDFIPVDYMFLDLCSNCNAWVIRWLRETSIRWLSPTARLAFTFCGKARMNVNWFKLVIKMSGGRMPDSFYANLAGSVTNWAPLLDEPEDRAFPLTTLLKTQFLVVAQALPWEFRLRESLLYKDMATPMVFFHGFMTGLLNPYIRESRQLLDKWFEHRPAHSIKPIDLTPQEWAWHIRNPRSIRKLVNAKQR